MKNFKKITITESQLKMLQAHGAKLTEGIPLKESFHDVDGTPIGVDSKHRPTLPKVIPEAGPEQDWTHYQEKRGLEDRSVGEISPSEKLYKHFMTVLKDVTFYANMYNDNDGGFQDLEYKLKELNQALAKFKGIEGIGSFK